jgi:hypothetical protein
MRPPASRLARTMPFLPGPIDAMLCADATGERSAYEM